MKNLLRISQEIKRMLTLISTPSAMTATQKIAHMIKAGKITLCAFLLSVILLPTFSFAQITQSPARPGPEPRGGGGCDSTCLLGAPPPTSQSCVLQPEVRKINCSPPTPVGTINQRRSPVYCNGTIVSGGTWTNVSSNCVPLVCTPTTTTRSVACPALQTGTIDQSKTDTTCNDGTSTTGTWATTANNCVDVCVPTTDTQTIPCPFPQTGTITQNRVSTYCGPSATLTSQSPWAYVSDTCVPPPPAFCNPKICVNGGTYNGTRCERATACLTGTTANPGLEYYTINTGIRNGGAGCPATSAWTTSTAATCAPIVCPAAAAPSLAPCGPGYDTGNKITTYTMGSPPICTPTSTVNNASCSCSLTTKNTLTACGTLYSGGNYTVTQTRNAACTGYNIPTNNFSSICKLIICPASSSSSASCPSNYTGSITTTYTYGPAPACTLNSAVSNTCKCNLTTITTPNNLCPPPYTGYFTITNTPNMTTCTYGPPTNDSATVCKSAPPPIVCPVGRVNIGNVCTIATTPFISMISCSALDAGLITNKGGGLISINYPSGTLSTRTTVQLSWNGSAWIFVSSSMTQFGQACNRRGSSGTINGTNIDTCLNQGGTCSVPTN